MCSTGYTETYLYSVHHNSNLFVFLMFSVHVFQEFRITLESIEAYFTGKVLILVISVVWCKITFHFSRWQF